MTDEALIAQAKAMVHRAWAPYSHYHVGAALLGSDGQVYTGCNIESASFGATICAERCAIAAAFAAGCRSFTRAAVISDHDAVCTPCGICRQLLAEFSDNLIVLCCRPNGTVVKLRAEELLPYAFGSDSMAEADSAAASVDDITK